MAADRWTRTLDAFADRLDQMVSLAVSGAARPLSRRLIASLAVGSGLWLAALCLLLPFQPAPPAVTLPLMLAVPALVLPALALASRGRNKPAAAAALAGGALAAASLGALGGGLASPLAVAAPALACEAWRMQRCRRAALIGGAAAAVALSAAAAAAPSLPLRGGVSALFWLPVLLWAGAVLVAERRRTAKPEGEGALAASLSSDAAVLRFEPNGEVADVSDKARELLCLAPEFLLAGGLFERLHVADRVVFLSAMADLRGGARRRRVPVRLRLPREPRPAPDRHGDFTLELLLSGDPARPFTGFLRLDADGPAWRAGLEHAAAARAQAERERAEQLARLGHELRTPLTAIIGFADLLRGQAGAAAGEARRKDYAGLIASSGTHLLGVADAMLAGIGSGAEPVRAERFALGEAVEACRTMVALEAERQGVAIASELGDAAGSVSADRRIVKQVLLNLLSNAVKFTPPGGRVAIGAERVDDGFKLWVRDNGVGIEEKDLRRLGTPYARFGRDARNVGCEGSGIGLSLVRELVARHGGEFSASSRPGHGTLVCVSFPSGTTAHAGATRTMTEEDCHGTLRQTA